MNNKKGVFVPPKSKQIFKCMKCEEYRREKERCRFCQVCSKCCGGGHSE